MFNNSAARPCREVDSECLDNFFEDIKARGRQRQSLPNRRSRSVS